MPPSGDPPWRNSGISSSLMVSNCLSNFGGGGNKLDFPNPCLGRKLEEEAAMEGNEDLGGFFFVENGSWPDGLQINTKNKCIAVKTELHLDKHATFVTLGSVVYLPPRRGVAGGAESVFCSMSFSIAVFWKLLSDMLFSAASVSSSSASASMPITPYPEFKQEYLNGLQN